MDRLRTLRNIAIVALIAAAVEFLPGGGRVAEAFAAVLWIVFAAGMAYFAYRIYRERRLSLYSLGQRHRALLYGSAALAFFTAAARSRMWETGLGELVWFVMLGAVVFGLMSVYRFSRSY
jgi:hypothetical protein